MTPRIARGPARPSPPCAVFRGGSGPGVLPPAFRAFTARLAGAPARAALAALAMMAVLAVEAGAAAQAGPGRLTGLEKQHLLAIAAEPVAALREGRPPRAPQVSGALTRSLPLAVSLYLDGRLISRHWEIRQPGPLSQSAMLLAAQALSNPRWGVAPTPADAPRLKAGITVLHGFFEIKDDNSLPEGHGVVVMNGFKEGLAGPMDVAEGAGPSELLAFASQIAGMRPGGWLVPETVIFASPADEAREE